MYEKKQKMFTNYNPNKKVETVSDVEKYPFKACPDRGITEETCKRFGIKAGLSEKMVRQLKLTISLPTTKRVKWLGTRSRILL